MADLKKVRRILLDLKAAGNFLRQYPHLAARVASALEKQPYEAHEDSGPETAAVRCDG